MTDGRTKEHAVMSMNEERQMLKTTEPEAMTRSQLITAVHIHRQEVQDERERFLSALRDQIFEVNEAGDLRLVDALVAIEEKYSGGRW